MESKLNFSKKIYSKEALKKAQKAFKGLASFEKNENESFIEIKIIPKKGISGEKLKDEFCNYALFETKNEI